MILMMSKNYSNGCEQLNCCTWGILTVVSACSDCLLKTNSQLIFQLKLLNQTDKIITTIPHRKISFYFSYLFKRFNTFNKIDQ